MATKPVATFTHATDATFGSGPATGFPTKLPVPSPAQGFVPGAGIAAEQVNTQFNVVGQWLTNWLALGSAAASVDAHLVETDSGGFARVAGFVAGGTAAGGFAFTASENSGSPTSTAVITNSSSGNAVDARCTDGIAVLATSIAGGVAVRAIGNGAGPAVLATAGASSTAVTATGNVASGRASVECSMPDGSVRAPLYVGTQAVGPSGTFQGDVSMPSDNGDVLTVHQRHPNTGAIGAGRGLWGNGQGLVGGIRSNTPNVDVVGVGPVTVLSRTVTMRTGQVVFVQVQSPLGGNGVAGNRGTVDIQVVQPTLGTVNLATHGLRYDGAAGALLVEAYMSEAAGVSFSAGEDGVHTFEVVHTGVGGFTTRWLVPALFILGDTIGF